MKKNDLLHVLQQEGVRPDSYDLEDGSLNERYCLHQEREVWLVYYSERGLRTGAREFLTEDEACRYFIDLVMADPSTRS